MVAGAGPCCRVVVKGTFIELMQTAGLRARAAQLRKSKTDSVLEEQPAMEEDYEPGRFSKEDAARRSASSSARSTQPESARTAGLGSSEPEVLRAGQQEVVAAEPHRPQASRSWGKVVEPASTSKGSASQRVQPQRPAYSLQRSEDERTTVMLRNLPNNYTRATFLGMLDGEGFSGLYDFVYLPMDFDRRANLGYAFVNLCKPETVSRFWKAFDGFSKWALPTAKVCQVGWSGPYQGLQAHIERYKNSPVMHKSVPDDFKPMIFSAGMRRAFPPATKALRPPCRRN